MRKLGLIGFAGSGKTTVLGEAKGSGFKTLDTDRMLFDANVDVSSFIIEGELDKLRKLERKVVLNALNSDVQIIAFGGGFHSGHCAWDGIDASMIKIIFLKESFEACVKKAPDRPLLRKLGVDEYRRLYESRMKQYLDAADATINVNGKAVKAIWKEVEQEWN